MIYHKKYCLSDITTCWKGHTLRRIKSLISFTAINGTTVEPGCLGGFIEDCENLAQEGTCWIFGNAKAYQNAHIQGSACIEDNAEVYDAGTVTGNSRVRDNSAVYNNAIVTGCATIKENSRVYGNAIISGNATMKANSQAQDNSRVTGGVMGENNILKSDSIGRTFVMHKTNLFSEL